MAIALLLLLGGTAILALGAEASVRGTERLSAARGIAPFAIGALLFGVDVEGLGTALVAAGGGRPSIAAGEAFGAVVFLFSAAFGAALLLARAPVPAPAPSMILLPSAALAVGAAALTDGFVSRGEGGLLTLAYAAYVALVAREGGTAGGGVARLPGPGGGTEGLPGPGRRSRGSGESRRVPPAAELLGGLAAVSVGAALLVAGGVRILTATSLSEGFVGAALVGALVSADEVFLEILPIRRGVPELATGNLFGTVAASPTVVVGLAAVVRPLAVDSAALTAFVAAAALYALVAGAFLLRGRAGRVSGVAVLAAYLAWVLFAAHI